MFKFLKNIFIDMSEEIENLKEEYSKYSYQWIKGDNISFIQNYQDIIDEKGKKYMVFTDKTRISLDLVNEYMTRVEKSFNDNQLIPQNKIPAAEIKSIKNREANTETTIITQIKPIFSLLSKQKENWVKVELKLVINLPQKNLWDILLDSFDNAENDILEYVTKDLDIEVVRSALRDSIKDIYKSQKTNFKNVRSQDTISE